MIYTKTIGDRQVFSDCKTIQANDGTWISNPTAQQIADAGWVEYVPPVVPPTPQTEPSYDEMLNAVKKMLSSSIEELTDEQALEVAALYPTWASKDGQTVEIGERLWYNEALYKVIQAHTVQSDWTPDVASSLYVQVSIEEWPEWVQPLGAQDAYRVGDKVSHNDKHWVNDMDYNTYEPGVYGWTEVN